MTIELSEKDIKVIISALNFHIREDDIFFGDGYNGNGLYGRDYKETLKKINKVKEEGIN